MKKTTLIVTIALLGAVQPVWAQAPGWHPTGGWQCGPHVRIDASTDGRDGMDFFIRGAWFDNHYTMRRGQLFYNGVPCAQFGFPLGPPPRPASQVRPRECVPDTVDAKPGDVICE
jgi:hypothetical protein